MVQVTSVPVARAEDRPVWTLLSIVREGLGLMSTFWSRNNVKERKHLHAESLLQQHKAATMVWRIGPFFSKLQLGQYGHPLLEKLMLLR